MSAGDGGAAAVQDRADAEQARKTAARGQINQIFGYDDPNSANMASRNAGYDKIKTDTQAYFQNPLDEQTATATRQNKFALLRRGLVNDSQTIEQNKLLDRARQVAMGNINTTATTAANSARSADEQSRLDILSRIDAGLDVGSATQTGLSELNQSGQNALAAAKGNTLGDVFGNAGLLYSRDQYNQGLTQAPNRLAAITAAMNYGSNPARPYYGTN